MKLRPLTLLGLLAACAYDDTASPSSPQATFAASTSDVNAVALPEGMSFVGLRARGRRLSPRQLQDAAQSITTTYTFEGIFASGRGSDPTAQHHIVQARVVGGRRSAGGVALFRVEYRHRGVWRPLCEEGAEGVLIAGSVDATNGSYDPDPSSHTWACLGSAAGQCAAMGYLPLGDTQTHEVGDLFASCVRAVRADYCGDGTPGARALNGTSIDIYDHLGIASPGAEGAALEADWDVDGAHCLYDPSRVAARCARTIPACEGDPRGVTTRVAP